MTLPILLVMVTGIGFAGITINNYVMLTDAVSVGTHLLSISRGQTSPDPCSAAVTAAESAAPFLRTGGLTFTVYLNGVTFTSPASGCGASAINSDLLQGDPVSMKATYTSSLGFSIYGFTLAPTLTSQLTEITQ